MRKKYVPPVMCILIFGAIIFGILYLGGEAVEATRYVLNP